MNKFVIVTFFVFFLTGCSQKPNPELLAMQTQYAELETEINVANNQLSFLRSATTKVLIVTATLTSTPVFTSTPEYTPTITPTPTNTATATSTPTPFNIASCRDLISDISIPSSQYIELVNAQIDSYNGKCIRLIFDQEYGYLSPNNFRVVFANPNDYLADIYRTLIIEIDENTPSNVKKPTQYSYVWGIFQAPSTLLIQRVDAIQNNQWPIHDDVLYRVGIDDQISPGVWKSSRSSTDTDSCYWARINPVDGEIIENHFGIGGLAIRINEGEIFETNDECLSWYYVGP